MYRLSCYGLIGLGVLHMIVLGIDAANEAPAWFTGELWTWEHWRPATAQSRDMVLSGLAFWSTVGSFAVPMMVLGGLLLWLDRRGVVVPRVFAVIICLWLAGLALLMPPSGFPLGVLVMLGVIFGRPGRPQPTTVSR